MRLSGRLPYNQEMRFSPEFLDQIRSRLPLSEVIGRRVKLRKQGREWVGLSPFNKEKSPSFFVNDQKGFFHDFSSGKHGDIFDFLIETEGVAFPEAVERLAHMAGLDVPRATPQDAEREKKRASLIDVMDMAARFFEASLSGSLGEAARGYLRKRALSHDTQKRFRLGYAPPERSALKRHLISQGIAVEHQIEAGLLVAGEGIAEPYDRFRDRLMFPIEDARGRIIAFGGRALSSEVSAKYLNSPDTPLFHKGNVVFNHHRARAAAHHAGSVIVVEGYMDVIALAQAGIEHVVAPLGTALTPDQMNLLWRMANEPVLCFDGDKAGLRAAYRAVDTALPLIAAGKSIRFAFLPEGQDPDDLVRSAGRQAIEGVLAAAQPLVDVLWARELSRGPLETPEQRAAMDGRIRDLVREIRDEGVRIHYAGELEARLSRLIPVAAVPRLPQRPYDRGGRGGRFSQTMPNNMRSRGARFAPASPLMLGRFTRSSPREATLIAALVRHPSLVERHLEAVVAMELSSPDTHELRQAVVDIVSSGMTRDHVDMIAALHAANHADRLTRVLNTVPPGIWWIAPDTHERDVETGFLQCLALHNKARALHKELKEAERVLGEDASEASFAHLVSIQQQIQTVEGTEAAIEGFGASSGRPVKNF